MSRMTMAARAAFALAGQEAERLGSAAVDCEHLFLGLCQADAISEMKPEETALPEAELRALRGEAGPFAEALKAGGLDAVAARRRLRALW